VDLRCRLCFWALRHQTSRWEDTGDDLVISGAMSLDGHDILKAGLSTGHTRRKVITPLTVLRHAINPGGVCHISHGEGEIGRGIVEMRLTAPPSSPAAVNPIRSASRRRVCGAHLWQDTLPFKPLPEDRVFMHLKLTVLGQSHVRIHLGLSLLFYPFPVLRT
jgi:hypothetical protein